jgi:CheY-like chemotaxis protein
MNSIPHWDLFVSHASDDKAAFVQPLVDALQRLGLNVWYDTDEILIGSSVASAIEAGLRQSSLGLVILSPAYLRKEWTKKELRYYLSMEADGRPRVLPIWHNVDLDDIKTLSPLLVDRFALSSALGVSNVAHTLTSHLKRLRSADDRSIQAVDSEASRYLLDWFSKAGNHGPQGNLEGPSRTVLLVDDHALILEGIKQLLHGAEGFDVLVAQSISQARELLRSQPVHLILLDINLPDITGIDGSLAFGVEAPHVPIAYLSAMSVKSEFDSYLGDRHAAFISKFDVTIGGGWIDLCRMLADANGPYAICVGRLGLGPANFRFLADTRRICGSLTSRKHLTEDNSQHLELDALLRHKVQDFVRDFCRSQNVNDPKTACAHLLRERAARLQRLVVRRNSASRGTNFIESYVEDVRFEHARATFEIDITPDGTALFEDGERGTLMRMCLMELVDNALESTDRQISIKISGRRRVTQGDYLLAVSNNGPSIDKSVASHLFREGFTTRGIGRGLGLWLMSSIGPHHGIALQILSVDPVSFGLRVDDHDGS